MALAELRIIYRSNSHAPFWVVAEKSGDLGEERFSGQYVSPIGARESGGSLEEWPC